MVQIRHVQELERKVQAALSLIESLRKENAALKQKLDGYQNRIGELESLVQEFKEDQGAIEEGILRALKQLDSLEDSVTGAETEPSDVTETTPAAVEADETETDEDGDAESIEEEEVDAPDTGENELDIF